MKLKVLYPALLSFYYCKSSFAGSLPSSTDESSQIQSTGGGEEKDLLKLGLSKEEISTSAENRERHLWERKKKKSIGEKYIWELNNPEKNKIKPNSIESPMNEIIAKILFDDIKQFSLDDYMESDGKQWCTCRKQFNVDNKKLDEIRDEMFKQIRKSVFDSIISGALPLHHRYIERFVESDTVPLEKLEKLIEKRKQREKSEDYTDHDGIMRDASMREHSERKFIHGLKPEMKPQEEGWYEKLKMKMVGVCLAIGLMALAFFTMKIRNSGQNRLSPNGNCRNHYNSQDSIVPISEYSDDDDHNKYDKCPDGNQNRGPGNYELAIINDNPRDFCDIEGNQHINALPRAAYHALYSNIVLPDKGLRKSVLNTGINTDVNTDNMNSEISVSNTSCSASVYTENDDEKYMKDTDIRGSRTSMVAKQMLITPDSNTCDSALGRSVKTTSFENTAVYTPIIIERESWCKEMGEGIYLVQKQN